MESKTFLVALKLEGKRCLVVGCSDEAVARARHLVAAGASIVLVGDPLPSSAASLGQSVELARRSFVAEDFEGAFLAVLADRDESLARRMQAEADARNTLFCAVDQPAFGNFSHPAISRTGSLSLAVSTDGRAPAFSRRIREELDRIFSQADIAGFMERLSALRERTPSDERRKVLGEAVAGVRLTGRLDLGEEEPR
jgi:precorrin-2 dehydrogenase/sirohydrochlorin ferrochelatase